ncbi:hypothetical protein [Flavobacterium crassostreae]|uniref:Uncharacterized protein n=1 Tax=Flavobacterium crassostreae TaxID=1763534 RepID=A0A1B9E5P1_9FLAO|nr:hypothetical protein [Flavobacterium crassostreae]OCB77257.1 hypothetical protein LPBF_04455 [Flavobacterium crassostreae]
MKLFLTLFLTLFLGKSCENTENQDINTAMIEYVANTRGFYQKITIQKQTVTVSRDRNQKEKIKAVAITDTDWKMLITLFQEVDLEELKDLKSPTEKRFFDGAAIANLKIIYQGKTYESASFDHGFPPLEIKRIVTKINTFAKQNNEY